MQGKTLATAAAVAGMSERSAHRWREGELPSDRKKPRHWRTHPDPFAGIWAEAIEPLLASDRKGVLQAPVILQWLQDEHPGPVRRHAAQDPAAPDPRLAGAERPRQGGLLPPGPSPGPRGAGGL